MKQFFKKISKRGLALFLALTMCVSLLQVTAFADGGEGAAEETPVVLPTEPPAPQTTTEVLTPEPEVNTGEPTETESGNGKVETTTVSSTTEFVDGQGNKVTVTTDGDADPAVTTQPADGVTGNVDLNDVNDAPDDVKVGENKTIRKDGAIVTTDGDKTTVYYPKDGVTETTSEDGTKSTYSNADGSLVSTTEKTGENTWTETTTAKAGDKTTTTVTVYHMDGDNKVVEKSTTIGEDGTTTTQGNVKTVEDENGNKLVKGDVTQTTAADGTVIVTDKDGNSVAHYTDGTTVTKVGGTTQVKDSTGTKEERQDAEGNTVTTFESTDKSTRTQKVVDADNNVVAVVSIKTAADGGKTVTKQSSEGVITYTLDKDGKVTKCFRADDDKGTNVAPVEITEGMPVPDFDSIKALTPPQTLADAAKGDDLEAVDNYKDPGTLPGDTKIVEQTSETNGNTTTTTVTTKTTEVEVKSEADDAKLTTVITTEKLEVTTEKLTGDQIKLLQETDSNEAGKSVYDLLVEKIKSGEYQYTDDEGNIYIVTKVVKTTTKVPVNGATGEPVGQSDTEQVEVASSLKDWIESNGAKKFNDGGGLSLGDVMNFAVFAKTYESNGHTEANVAVDTLILKNGNHIGVVGDNYKGTKDDYYSANYVGDKIVVSPNADGNPSGDNSFNGNPRGNHVLVVGDEYKEVTKDKYYATEDGTKTINPNQYSQEEFDIKTIGQTGKINFDEALNNLAVYADRLKGQATNASHAIETKEGSDAVVIKANAQTNQEENNQPAITTYIVNVSKDELEGKAIFVEVPNVGSTANLVINVTGLYDETDVTKGAGTNVSISKKVVINGQQYQNYQERNGKILFNFGSYAGTASFGGAGNQTGSVLAPKATVVLNETHDGNIIADTVRSNTTNVEVHKMSPFDGPTVTPKPEESPTVTDSVSYDLQGVVKMHASRTQFSRSTVAVPDPPRPVPFPNVNSVIVPRFDVKAPEAPADVTPTPTPEPTTPPPTPEPTTPPTTPEPTPTPSTPPTTPPTPVNPPPEVEVPDPETPLDERPPEEVEIEDPEIPLDEFPPDEIELDDPDIPLADVPETGDISLMWYAALPVSACGLAAVTLRKKRGEQTP